jgi:hypothetical protein
MVEEKKVNGQESKTNRNFQQKKAALIAKTSFIDENYDYESNVKDMSLETFRQIQSSNDQVNNQLVSFIDKLSVSQVELSKIMAIKSINTQYRQTTTTNRQ